MPIWQSCPTTRATLQDLQLLIKGTVPDVQERISYVTPVIFAVKRDLVGFVAQEKQLSFFFTMSPELAKSMRDEIKAIHRVSGATIHFSPDNPLPRSLVRKLTTTPRGATCSIASPNVRLRRPRRSDRSRS
jgi:uncharacterized protein YdhG (YjbR/CyaY superfamily)